MSNKWVTLQETDSKYFSVVIDKKISKELYDFLDEFCSQGCKQGKKGWLLKRVEADRFLSAVETAVFDFENPSEPESESSESDTDDECIQQVLARRLVSESTMDVIDDDNIEDSEMEDVVSLCRRTRGIYKVLRDIRENLNDITSALNVQKMEN